ncbi:hypothetical protein D3C85_1374780 [compost metagenome]
MACAHASFAYLDILVQSLLNMYSCANKALTAGLLARVGFPTVFGAPVNASSKSFSARFIISFVLARSGLEVFGEPVVR